MEKSFFYRYCVVIPEKYSKVSEFFIEKLKENNFSVQSITDQSKEKNICIVFGNTNEEKMLRTAQELKIKKTYTGNEEEIDKELNLPQEIIDIEKKKPFTVAEKDKFISDKEYDEIFSDPKEKEKNKRWGLGLFTENEMLYIEKVIFEEIPIEEKDKVNLINLIEGSGCGYVYQKNIHLIDMSSLYTTLSNVNLITDRFPIHISDISQKIVRKSLFKPRFPYPLIRSYFSDQVALYFAWTYHYSRFLIIPGVASIILSVLVSISHKTAKYLLPFYAILISIWVQFFIIYWNRKTSELKIKWDNYDEKYEKENKRKEFVGEWIKSPISGKYELSNKKEKTLMKYLVSIGLTVPMLILSIVINVIFLNMRGFIREESDSIFLIRPLRNMANKGGVFAEGSVPNGVIGVVQAMLIQFLNELNKKLAIHTSNIENHKTKSSYENSMIIKRFLFNFFNSFFSLYYLAFIIRDLQATNGTIKSLVYFSEFQRLIGTTIVPTIMKAGSSRRFISFTSDEGDEDKYIIDKPIDKVDLLKQKANAVYNTFDDYLELILEFCYLTLFAECIPISAAILMIVNQIEIRSDLIKVGTLVRRPEFIKKRNIGSWQFIINIVAALTVFTNLIFSYIFSTSLLGQDKFRSLFSFCVSEHLVFGAILALRLLWPSVSEWVVLFLKRKEYREKNSRYGSVLKLFKGTIKK